MKKIVIGLLVVPFLLLVCYVPSKAEVLRGKKIVSGPFLGCDCTAPPEDCRCAFAI